MNFSPRELKLAFFLNQSGRQDVISNRLAELREQLPPPQSIAEAPTELLEYILCHQLMLNNADRALRVASIALTGVIIQTNRVKRVCALYEIADLAR